MIRDKKSLCPERKLETPSNPNSSKCSNPRRNSLRWYYQLHLRNVLKRIRVKYENNDVRYICCESFVTKYSLFLLNNYDPKLRNKNIVDDQSSILFHYFLYPNVYHIPSFSLCTILKKNNLIFVTTS